MKRGAPRRRKPLGAKPERVREFMQRGRGQLARSPLKRKRPERPAEGPLGREEWRREVFRLSAGRSIITGACVDVRDPSCFHHPMPKHLLPPEWRWDPRNGVAVTPDEHARHESAYARIPRELLPQRVWEFAAEMDRLRPGTAWATEQVKRLHPAGTHERS